MRADYIIGLATPDDIPGIMALQEENLPNRGGSLSVRLPADWFARAMQELPLVVARRDGRVVGYVVVTPLEAQLHIPIVQEMLAKFPAPPDCFIQGPVCVSERERGNNLAGMMFAEMRKRLPGRVAITFIRSDNAASLRAHEKIGLCPLGEFESDGECYTAVAYLPWRESRACG
jgi:L-amino acid N-acyltransferase YncA